MPDYFAPCPRGLESLLQQDLESYGAQQVIATDGGVHFSGDWALCYQVNLHNRLASRVLWKIKQANYRSEEDIYRLAMSLSWPRWFAVNRTIRVKTTAIRCPLKSLEFVTLRVKDAICDVFRKQDGERPSVDTSRPDIRIQVFIEEQQVMLYLDTSGESLFKRGVRQYTNIAPIRENLAAGILRLAQWQPGVPLFDPMCGSGTFLIEAVQMTLNIAPGIQREFAFEKLRNFDAARWQSMKQQALDAQQEIAPLAIWGSDIDAQTIHTAQRNLVAAGYDGCVTLQQADVLDVVAPATDGVLIANLPYGERMGELEELAQLYPKLGDVLKRQFSGWMAYLFTADRRILKLMRLSASRKIPLYNGAIDCRLFQYKLISGSNRSVKG